MTTGSRTEGLKGIGAEGFIRTVKNLTVTGDLVVHGETRSTVGTGHDVSAFWETADANANYWAYDLPAGGATAVPVMGVGIGLRDVDLGLFAGLTQPTLAVLDADRDSYLVLDFSADDSPRIRSNQDITVSGNVVFSDNITVQGTTTTVSSSVVVIDDPLFHLANDNPANSVDLGIIAEYTDSGKKFAGLFRDASDSDKWKLFATTGNSHEEPSTTVNTTSGFTLGNLAVNELEGTLTTASQTNITAVGTIATGTWEGTTIAVDQGGTGATSLNNLITLTTHTTGNYVATVTAGTGLTSTGATSGEGIAHGLSVDAAQTGITSVGALDGGSITSNFGTIDTGASSITTTGLISGGSLDIDNVEINGNTISTSTSSLTLDPTTELTFTLTANTNNALSMADGTTTLFAIDSRNTTADTYVFGLDSPNVTLADASSAVHQLIEFKAYTITLAGTTQVTTAQKTVNIEATTINQSGGAVTVDQASTFRIAGAPSAGGSVTITEALALYVDAGASRFDGAISMTGDLTVDGDLDFTGAQEISTSAGALTLAPAADLTINVASAKVAIFNTTAPTLSNDTHAGEALFLRSGGSAGDDEIQAVLAFGKADSTALRSGSAIGSVQTDGDTDKVGLAFYTSTGSASSQTMGERVRITHDGNMEFAAAQTISTGAGVLTLNPTTSTNLLRASDGTIATMTRNAVAGWDWYIGNTALGSGVAGTGSLELRPNVASVEFAILQAGTTNVKFAVNATLGNTQIGGTADHGTTVGTNVLSIFDGAAPAGTLANGISLYSTSGECRVMDAAGNATLLSPHDSEGDWIFDSTDVDGKRLVIHMEKFMKALEAHFGWGFIEEFMEEA
jgi:hypothetical protein